MGTPSQFSEGKRSTFHTSVRGACPWRTMCVCVCVSLQRPLDGIGQVDSNSLGVTSGHRISFQVGGSESILVHEITAYEIPCFRIYNAGLVTNCYEKKPTSRYQCDLKQTSVQEYPFGPTKTKTRWLFLNVSLWMCWFCVFFPTSLETTFNISPLREDHSCKFYLGGPNQVKCICCLKLHLQSWL